MKSQRVIKVIRKYPVGTSVANLRATHPMVETKTDCLTRPHLTVGLSYIRRYK